MMNLIHFILLFICYFLYFNVEKSVQVKTDMSECTQMLFPLNKGHLMKSLHLLKMIHSDFTELA